MPAIPKVHESMSKHFVALRPDADVFAAIDQLVSKGVSGAPVVDEDGRILGILTEKDCIRLLSTSAYSNVVSGTVREFMSEVKRSITPEMDLFSVAQLFLSTNFPALPVLGEEDELVGVMTRSDVLRGIQKLQRSLAEEQAAATGGTGWITPLDIQRMVARHSREVLAALLSGRLNTKS